MNDFFFQFVALGVLALTIWNLGNQTELIDLLTSATYSVLIDFLIIAGALLLIVSFLGCFGVIKENRRVLLIVSVQIKIIESITHEIIHKPNVCI